MDERTKQIVDRISQQLADDGYVKADQYNQTQYGIGSSKSYFEALIDRKLAGYDDYPTAEQVWSEMKAQINWYSRQLLRASEEYSKLESRLRGAEDDIRDLRKELNDKEKV